MTTTQQNQTTPTLAPQDAKTAWDAVCAIYRTLGTRHGSVDANHALALAEIQTRLPLTQLAPGHRSLRAFTSP